MAPTYAHSPTKSAASKPHNQKKRTRARNGTITPIIKIVQVYAPKRVETDVANFRRLVQAMTGNDSVVGHNIKEPETISSTQASANDETVRKDEERVANSRTSKAQPCTHREGSSSASSGESLIVQGREKERRTYAAYVSDEEGGELCEYGDMESSCEQSVDSFFAESEVEVRFEDHFCKAQPQQTYCGAYFATMSAWRPPLQEIPGGFESFDCF